MRVRSLILFAALTGLPAAAFSQTSEVDSQTFTLPITYALVPFDTNVVMMAPLPASVALSAAASVSNTEWQDGGDGISDTYMGSGQGECEETKFH